MILSSNCGSINTGTFTDACIRLLHLCLIAEEAIPMIAASSRISIDDQYLYFFVLI